MKYQNLGKPNPSYKTFETGTVIEETLILTGKPYLKARKQRLNRQGMLVKKEFVHQKVFCQVGHVRILTHKINKSFRAMDTLQNISPVKIHEYFDPTWSALPTYICMYKIGSHGTILPCSKPS